LIILIFEIPDQVGRVDACPRPTADIMLCAFPTLVNEVEFISALATVSYLMLFTIKIILHVFDE
jgi:hypothetical protein